MTAERIRPNDPLLLINPTFLFLLACAERAATEAQEGEDVEIDSIEAQEEEAKQTTTNSLPTGGATAGALGAIVMHQNVFEGAIIGGATGAAMAAAMYGAGKAIQRSKQSFEVTIEGKRVKVQVKEGLTIKVKPEDAQLVKEHWPEIEKILLKKNILIKIRSDKTQLNSAEVFDKTVKQITYKVRNAKLTKLGTDTKNLLGRSPTGIPDPGDTAVTASVNLEKVDAFITIHAPGNYATEGFYDPSVRITDAMMAKATGKYMFFIEGGQSVNVIIPGVDRSIYLEQLSWFEKQAGIP